MNKFHGALEKFGEGRYIRPSFGPTDIRNSFSRRLSFAMSCANITHGHMTHFGTSTVAKELARTAEICLRIVKNVAYCANTQKIQGRL